MRKNRIVDIDPGGPLSKYIPFYFTPFSPMMYNIYTGFGGIRKRDNKDIVILVTSLYKLADDGITFVYTDRHAYLRTAEYFSDLADLNRIDWEILQKRDFKSDPDDMGKKERYQAEALVHDCISVDSLLGVVCYNNETEGELRAIDTQRDGRLKIMVQPGWYF